MMKGRALAIFVGFSIGLFLLIGSFPQPASGVVKQGPIQEIEPNNNKDQAQPISIGPGETVEIQGSVSRQEDGTPIAEMAKLVGLVFDPETNDVIGDDAQEDWYVIDVNGSLDFSLQLNWTGAADLDTWTFADISDQVFPDGLVSVHLEAKKAINPEAETSRIYYTYSDRTAEVDGLYFSVPETSRYYITVSVVDDGVSLPATYTLRLSSPVPGTTHTMLDGRGPGLYTAVKASDVLVQDQSTPRPAQRLMALRRVTPKEYPARLDRVDLLQFYLDDSDTSVPTPLDLVVMTDPLGTGNPANATEVLRRRVRVEAIDAENLYPVDDANIVVQSGDIYAGFEIAATITPLHIPFEVNKAGFGRTFISTDSGKTFGVLRTLTRDIGIPFVSEAAIDAALTINPPPPKASVGSQQPGFRKVYDRKAVPVEGVYYVSLDQLGR